MYSFIWRKLPGNAWSKLALSLILVGGAVTLLWVFVFPWAEPLLPFDDVQVGTGTEAPGEVPGDDVIPYPTVNNPEPTITPEPTSAPAPTDSPAPTASRSAS